MEHDLYQRTEEPYSWVGGAIRGVSAAIRAGAPALKAAANTVRQVRQLGVASEVGVSAETVAPASFVKACWALSIGYVVADIGVRVDNAKPEHRWPIFADLAIWHGAASLVVPAVIIGKLVHTTQHAVAAMPSLPGPAKKWVPVGVAIASIVPVVPAVDHSTDWVMDKTTRKMDYFRAAHLADASQNKHE